MTESRLRNDKGQFAEENAYMNSMFKNLCGLQPTTEPTPAPASPANSGQPVPPGAGPEPLEDENKEMNRMLLIMAGGIPSDSR